MPALEFQGYTNLVTRGRGGQFITNRYASFFLENRGQYALTYTGTPLPVYNVQHESGGKWSLLGDLARPDDLAMLLPGERLDFRVYIPETTNKWRVAVDFLRPSKVPYPFKRFFKPSLYPVTSGEILPWRDITIQLAAGTNHFENAGENLTK